MPPLSLSDLLNVAPALFRQHSDIWHKTRRDGALHRRFKEAQRRLSHANDWNYRSRCETFGSVLVRL